MKTFIIAMTVSLSFMSHAVAYVDSSVGKSSPWAQTCGRNQQKVVDSKEAVAQPANASPESLSKAKG